MINAAMSHRSSECVLHAKSHPTDTAAGRKFRNESFDGIATSKGDTVKNIPGKMKNSLAFDETISSSRVITYR